MFVPGYKPQPDWVAPGQSAILDLSTMIDI